MGTALLHEELTGRIRQIAFETHKYFRHGFLEKVYENALANRLRKAGIRVEQQVPITVFDEDGTAVGEYFADLLVEGVVIIELKLINFGAKVIQFKRVALSRDGEPEIGEQSE